MGIFGGAKKAESDHEKPLNDLKERISRLPTQFPTSAHTFGAGAMQAQEQIPIICRNIDQAVEALKTGIDPHGNPITRQQISSGLKNLVRATQNPAFTGLMTAVLDSNGIQQLEHSMIELERIADGIGASGPMPSVDARPVVTTSKPSINNGFVVGLIVGVGGGIGCIVPPLLVRVLRVLLPTLYAQHAGALQCIIFYIALGFGFFTAWATNRALIRRGYDGIGYRGAGGGRVVLGIIGAMLSWFPLYLIGMALSF